MHNRNERIICDNKDRGVACDWHWTSDLHIAKVFPSLGLQLMRRAFLDWPIELRNASVDQHDKIGVSFIIGHRGTDRLPHLLMTLSTIAAQGGVSCECIVIEQSLLPEVEDSLPNWVRYIHTPLPDPAMPYCRSWAFNVGARAAKGRLLVFHDNDMLVPREYASQLLARFREGYEVMNLKRFIFYLNEAHSKRICSTDALLLDEAPEIVVQNLEAGGSVAITRDAYFSIGGFDESFVGWGGEDNEFWERAQTRKVWPYGYLPIVHLWHTPQPGKHDVQCNTMQHYQALRVIDPHERIRRLLGKSMGMLV